MKPYVLALIIVPVCFFSITLSSQRQGANDTDAVRTTVSDYIQAYYNADPVRMERSLHPHYLKHTITGNADNPRMTEKTGLQLVEDIRAGQPVPVSARQVQVVVLDISGDIASAKLVIPYWVDYLTLSKWHGQWKIVSVVLRENE